MRKFKKSSKLVAILLAMLCTASSVALTSSAIEDGSSADTELSEYGLPKDSLYNTNKAMPDTWVFTDGLGRVSLTNAEVGDVREDKTIVMFYWDWHEDLGNGNGALNTTELMKLYPDAKNDYTHQAWKRKGRYCFWNEPIYGFYRTSDTWVLRRQAELLANLGVDAVMNDNTNGSMTWRNGYLPLYNEWLDAQADGVDVPKISFMFPFVDSKSTYNQLEGSANNIYKDIYSTDKYESLWFYFDGKPMLVGPNDNISDEIKEKFTWRRGQADYYFTSAPMFLEYWGWLSTYPQLSYSAERRDFYAGNYEQISVGVACNHDYRTHNLSAMNAGKYIMGRSYTSTYQDRYEKEGTDASLYGYFFSEQFDYALKQDPEVVFITGWNEWHAWRQPNPWGKDGVTNALVDQFDNEYSRDIEPTKGELKDHYYYLAANYIRKYKGANPIPTPSENQTIDMSAGYEQWANVAPYYASYIGNTKDRDNDGYGTGTGNKVYHYTETSGRNDIIGAQIARDDEYVYFHVECADNITSYTDSLWMNLYIDSDQNNQGWETFDYVINKSPASEKTLVLERFTEGYASEKVADVEYSVDGRYMTVKVPKSAIGVSGDDYTINFSWTDNVHDEGDYSTYSGDIMDFYISGDVAPGGRFKYSYISTFDNSGKEAPVVDDTTDTTGTEEVTEPNTEGNSSEQVTNAAENKGGCGSVIGMSVIMIPAVSAAAVSITVKRKKKKE